MLLPGRDDKEAAAETGGALRPGGRRREAVRRSMEARRGRSWAEGEDPLSVSARPKGLWTNAGALPKGGQSF